MKKEGCEFLSKTLVYFISKSLIYNPKKAKDDDFAQSLLRFDLPSVKSPDQKSSNQAKQKVKIFITNFIFSRAIFVELCKSAFKKP